MILHRDYQICWLTKDNWPISNLMKKCFQKQNFCIKHIVNSQSNIITDSPKISHYQTSLPSPPWWSRNQSWNWLVGWLVCQADVASQSDITKLLDNKKNAFDHSRLTKENLCLLSPDSSWSTVHPMWGILLSKRNHCQAGFHNAYAVCTLHYA